MNGLSRIRSRLAVGTGVLLILVLGGVKASSAVEIVPSVGLSRDVHGNGDVRASGGLAVRGTVASFFKTELAAGYRSTTQSGDLKIRQWPITTSLYVTPISALYLGGGVGWYQTTFDYPSTSLFKDETKQEFGVHLGGGVQVPLAGPASLDLSGRYVMMRDQQDRLVPGSFNPDFWTMSAGVAIKY